MVLFDLCTFDQNTTTDNAWGLVHKSNFEPNETLPRLEASLVQNILFVQTTESIDGFPKFRLRSDVVVSAIAAER